MFSKILIKLIDQAIVPAVLLITVKIVSVVLLCRYFGVNFTLESPGFVFTNTQEFLFINSYSTFAMVVALAVGILYTLLKSLAFHDSHITPGLTARLFSLRLSSFIQNSFDLYSQGTIWLSYLYLLLLVCAVMVVYKVLYPWVFLTTLALTIISTVVLVLDIEQELDLSKVDNKFAGFIEEDGEDLVVNL